MTSVPNFKSTSKHTSFFTFFRSSSVKFSNIFSGVAVAATLLLAVNEASAQLPVRTQRLVLQGSTSGTLTHQAAATTTAYTLTWPSAVVTTGNNGFLQSDENGILSWFEIPTGNTLVDVDANGAAGQVAYFTDGNTITSSTTFLYDAGTNNITLGNAAQPGTLILGGNGNVTLDNTATTAVTYNYPNWGPAGTVNVLGTTNQGTENQIPVVQADGSVQFVDNPVTGMQRGSVTATAGSYTTAITVVGTPDNTNDLILVTSMDVTGSPNGNLLSVTGLAANTITVSGSGPFTATERISWMWIAIP